MVAALLNDTNTSEFDLKNYFSNLLNLIHSYKTEVVDLRLTTQPETKNIRQYKFNDIKNVKIWRCPNKLFTFKRKWDKFIT